MKAVTERNEIIIELFETGEMRKERLEAYRKEVLEEGDNLEYGIAQLIDVTCSYCTKERLSKAKSILNTISEGFAPFNTECYEHFFEYLASTEPSKDGFEHIKQCVLAMDDTINITHKKDILVIAVSLLLLSTNPDIELLKTYNALLKGLNDAYEEPRIPHLHGRR